MGFMPRTTLVKDDREMVSNRSKTEVAEEAQTSKRDIFILQIFCLTDATLSVKKDTNSSHVAAEASDRTVGRGLMTESIVLNSNLGW